MNKNILDKINEFLNTNPEEALFEHDKLPQEKKDKYAEGFYIQNPRPNKEFDDYGLRYDIDYLNTLGTNILIAPVEYIANYVDVITKKLVDTNDQILIDTIKQDKDFLKEELNNINATSCGNMAYIYLHTKDSYVKDYMRRNLLNLHKWKVEQIVDYLKQIQN